MAPRSRAQNAAGGSTKLGRHDILAHRADVSPGVSDLRRRIASGWRVGLAEPSEASGSTFSTGTTVGPIWQRIAGIHVNGLLAHLEEHRMGRSRQGRRRSAGQAIHRGGVIVRGRKAPRWAR
jgi:hypothetical protein